MRVRLIQGEHQHDVVVSYVREDYARVSYSGNQVLHASEIILYEEEGEKWIIVPQRRDTGRLDE